VLARGLGAGDVVYQVFGYREPLFPGEDPEVDDKMEHIANIRLKTPLTQSSWADESLRFRHRPVGRDRRFWPREWRRLNEDSFFSKKDPDNVFGNEVPDWPDNDDDAQDRFIDQV